MFILYSWPTPNGQKIHIMFEECGLKLGQDWQLKPIDITKGEQFSPEFLAINPNNKIPALIDDTGPNQQPIQVFESGAILLYLAEKLGKFLPNDPRKKISVLQWLMFQMGGIGPMLGQAHHFRLYAPEPIAYAINRYTQEATRLYKVLNTRLQQSEYLGGDEYSIADIATYPWTVGWEKQGVDRSVLPHVERWQQSIASRIAVIRGMSILQEERKGEMSSQARENLFGKTQYRQGLKEI